LTGIFENNASARRPTKLLNQIHHDIVDDMVLDSVVDFVVDIVVSDVIVVLFYVCYGGTICYLIYLTYRIDSNRVSNTKKTSFFFWPKYLL
jgi:hypothetical protein